MTKDQLAALRDEVARAPTVELIRNRYGYEVDGEYFRRVTTYTGGLPKPWLGQWAAKIVAEYAYEHREEWAGLGKTNAIKLLKGAPWSKRDDAGDRGTAVHNALEALAHGRDPYEQELTDDERACVAAAKAFHEARGARPLSSEMTVVSRTHGYAGTLDLWEILGGETWLLDYKTSAGVYADHAVQQAAYAHAEFAIVQKERHAESKPNQERWTGKLIPWGREYVDRLGIVHVGPDEARLYPIAEEAVDRLWKTFRAAAFVKQWQLDTDDYRGEPRERIYEESINPSEGVNDDEQNG